MKFATMFFLAMATLFAQNKTRPAKSGDRVFDPRPSVMSLRAADNEANETIKKLIHVRNKSKDENDIIFNFASFVNQHSPYQQEICAGTKLLDEAVKRHLNKIGSNASPARRGKLFWQRPKMHGSCATIQPWIDAATAK